MTERYSWEAAYSAAILETAPAAFPLKVYAALGACELRRLSPVDVDEEKALAAAEAALRTMRSEGLGLRGLPQGHAAFKKP
jgi:hypothetical protein